MLLLPAGREKAPPAPEDDEADGWLAMPDPGRAWGQEVEEWFADDVGGGVLSKQILNSLWQMKISRIVLPGFFQGIHIRNANKATCLNN